MKITNLTPHNITIMGTNGKSIVVPASGVVARCETETKKLGRLHSLADAPKNSDGEIVLISTVKTTFGTVTNVPEYKDRDGIYIVSRIVLSALQATRDDQEVYAPGELIRDDAGIVVACKGLSK